MARPQTTDYAKILALHAKGLSNRQIAEKLGCSHTPVQTALKLHGLKSNYEPHGRPPTGVHWSKVISREQWERVVKPFLGELIGGISRC